MAQRKAQYRTAFETKIDLTDYYQARAALAGLPGAIEKASSAAVNKTLARLKTQVGRELTSITTIKITNLRRRLFVVKASRTSLQGSVKIMGRPIGLINFKVTDTRKSAYDPTGRGVLAQVFRGIPPGGLQASTSDLRYAFIATGLSENKHVFIRHPDAGRLPIETVFSQRLYDIFMKSSAPNSLKRFTPAELAKQYRLQVARYLAQGLKKKR